MCGTPWNYISRCEAALTAFENGGELPPGWTMSPVRSENELNEPFDPAKPLPEPPDILDLFESQRYISKLIQWGLEAANRARSRHLVERDDDQESESSRLSGMPASRETTARSARCSYSLLLSGRRRSTWRHRLATFGHHVFDWIHGFRVKLASSQCQYAFHR
jgi:hypothetical protein